MIILRIIPSIISALVLSAHFLRDGEFLSVLLTILAPFLFWIKERWSLNTLRLLIFLGGIIWLWTTIELVLNQIANEAPWFRMAIILVLITIFTFFSGYLLNSPVVKKTYFPPKTKRPR